MSTTPPSSLPTPQSKGIASLRQALRPRARAKRLWQRLVQRSEARMLQTGRGVSLHYGLLSDTFVREHRAVAAGRHLYTAARQGRRRHSIMLRRNVHRLEKGLVAEPARKIFALGFIDETVAEFEAVAREYAAPETPSPELTWARDVLEAYFEATGSGDPTLPPLERRFREAAARLAEKEGAAPSRPFLRDLTNRPVAIEALQALAVQRRSVRSYRPEPVPRALVDRAVAVAAQSPSACNRQPFSFLIFDDPAVARRVGAVPAGTKSYVDGLQAIVVVIGRLRAYPGERDRHAIYVDASLAAMAFMLGLEAQGVGSCAINWGDDAPREAQIARMLNLAPDERVVMMISYGWPAPEARVPFSAKRSLDELRVYASVNPE